MTPSPPSEGPSAGGAGDPRAFIRRATAALRGGRLESAREALEQAVEAVPGNREALTLLAALHLERGDGGLARAAADEAGVELAEARRTLEDLRAVMTPADLAEAAAIPPGHGPLEIVAPNLLGVPAGPTSHARLTSAIVYEGPVVCEPAPRRSKGRTEPAREDWAALYQVGGAGRVVMAVSGRLTILELRDEEVFLRESTVEAFDGPLVFENGRLPGGGPAMVHLSGRGRVAVRTAGQLRALHLPPQAGAQVAMDAVAGFFGGLFVRAVAKEGTPATAVCEGEGTLILRTPG